MAKKKKKATVNPNKEFTLAIRNLSSRAIKLSLKNLIDNKGESFVLDGFDSLKNISSNNNYDNCFKYLDRESFWAILNMLQDSFLSYSVNGGEDWGKFNILKEKTVNFFVEKNIGIESASVGYMISNMIVNDMLHESLERKELLSKLATVFIFYTLYINTFIQKFKNKKIKTITLIDNTINIIYSSEPMCSNKLLESFNNNNKSNAKSYGELFDSLASYLITPVMSFCLGTFDDGATNDYGIKMLLFNDKHPTSPFIKNDELLIAANDLIKIPMDRKYGILPSGVRFEFNDKTQGIDYIEMIESKEFLTFRLHLFNKGNMLYLDNTDLHNWMSELSYRPDILDMDGAEKYAKPLLKDKIKLVMKIPKKRIEDAKSLEDMVTAATFLPINLYTESRDTMFEIVNIVIACISCVYLAYYNPRLLTDTVKLYNIDRNNASGYTKGDSFRVAHIRNLPKGFKTSESALNEAKKYGFINIPEGKTFVSEHRVSMVNSSDNPQEEQRIIKIKK